LGVLKCACYGCAVCCNPLAERHCLQRMTTEHSTAWAAVASTLQGGMLMLTLCTNVSRNSTAAVLPPHHHLQVQQVTSVLVQVAQRWRDVRHDLHTQQTHMCTQREGLSSSRRVPLVLLPAGPVCYTTLKSQPKHTHTRCRLALKADKHTNM
jgi:hypothetical protein